MSDQCDNMKTRVEKLLAASKTEQASRKEATPLQKSIAGGTPTAPAKVPYGTSGLPKQSEGFSIVKAFAVAAGVLDESAAKTEMNYSKRLKGIYKGTHQHSILVPTSVNHLATQDADGYTIDGALELKKELSDALYATVEGYDPDEARYLKKTLSTVNDANGGALVDGTPITDMIDLQRNVEAFSKAGARQVTLGSNGRYSAGKLLSGSAAAWIGESKTGSNSDPKFGVFNLEAKKLGVFVSTTNEFLKFTTAANENMLRQDMALQSAQAMDIAMFSGAGGTSPLGLLNYDRKTTLATGEDYLLEYVAGTTGTDGNTFSPEEHYDLFAILPDEVQQAGEGNLKYMIHPQFARYLKKFRTDSGQASGDKDGPFLFDPHRGYDAAARATTIGGTPIIYSSNVPRNRVKGSGTNLTCVILGNFNEYVIARSGVAEFRRFDGTDTTVYNDTVVLRMIQFVDAGARRRNNFVVCDYLLPTV